MPILRGSFVDYDWESTTKKLYELFAVLRKVLYKEVQNGILKVSNVTKQFGHVTALDGISFEVGQGEIYGFIGPMARKDHHNPILLGC